MSFGWPSTRPTRIRPAHVGDLPIFPIADNNQVAPRISFENVVVVGLSVEPDPSVSPERLDPAEIAALYLQHAEPLRRFLLGVVRNAAVASDLLQATFAKALERGHASDAATRKAWLYRVALNEALAWKRRRATGERVQQERVQQQAAWRSEHAASDCPLIAHETVERVRAAIAALPAEQASVVRMRIYEDMTFAEIAERTGVPLGTILGRMRRALAKLRDALGDEA